MASPDRDTDFTTAVQALWDLDANRLTPYEDYKIDVQRSKHPCDRDDAADDPLFAYVDESAFERRPTYRAFRRLLNNYSAYTGDEEEVTEREINEQGEFLDVVMETEPMKYLHGYCLAKGAHYGGREVTDDESDFKAILKKIWFDLYSRSGRAKDSSGFEHVFAGEVKNGKVSGFHNWIMFWLEEKKGNIDYRGYIKPRSRDSTAETNDDDKILTLQFRFNGVEKFVGTSFIGVSPEFELALYTMAFMRTLHTGEEDNYVTLDVGGGEAFDLNVKCHTYNGDQVGSCYVEAMAHYD
ncbi:hypothetical protein ACHAW5_005714 [Stephanodiscus triporus]|uniref:EndoU domain-containing protein n=1 Tax=Stephanodiscus triporus TaxID=2934178 RepID=A0ABD3P1C9_9STRA